MWKTDIRPCLLFKALYFINVCLEKISLSRYGQSTAALDCPYQQSRNTLNELNTLCRFFTLKCLNCMLHKTNTNTLVSEFDASPC